MLESINIGIAGMHAYSDGLKTISNNVANMNTPGFKAKTSSFSDLLYSGGSSLGALRSQGYQQFGSGVTYGDTLINFKSGDLKTTNGELDLALDGRGFLVVKNSQGELVYMRTGQFELKDGNIVQAGTELKLMIKNDKGLMLTASTVGKEFSPPKASTTVTFEGNLSVDAAAQEHAIENVTVYDSLGGSHVLSVIFSAATTTVGALNQKDVTVKDDKGNTLKTGTISFTASGLVDTASAKLSVDVTAVGGTVSTISLDFSGSTVTGFSSGSTSTLAAKPADGYAQGSISAVTGTAEGKLQVSYTNGQKVILGDIVVADFDNLQDLEQIGGGQYRYTGTGEPVFAASSQSGMGAIKPGSIEGSNVNLSDEFGDLILVQRGFQASSQIISTANEMIGHVFELRSQR